MPHGGSRHRHIGESLATLHHRLVKWISLMQGLLLKSPLPECFCGPAPPAVPLPPPNSELLLSLHIWESLAGRTWGYCTPPHIMREAWQGKAWLIIHHHTGVCVHKTEKVDLKVKAGLLNTTFSFHCYLYILHKMYIAHKSVTIVLTSDHLLLSSLCFSSLGWIFSRWAWDGLRLLPPAVLAGRAYCGGGGDRHPAYLCVLCLPVLPPRLCLAVSGLLLCSQVGCEATSSLFLLFRKPSFNYRENNFDNGGDDCSPSGM